MNINENMPYKAARLIQWGLRAKERPSQEPEYKELINRYLDYPEFRDIVKEITKGLGVKIIDSGEFGIVLAPGAHSVFALKPGDFRPSLSSSDDRLFDGLVQVAIAATVFPKSKDLSEETSYARPPISVEDVEYTVRTICEKFEDESKNKPDPKVENEKIGLIESWRVYQRRVGVKEGKDDRKVRGTTRRIIESNLERLRDFGCFTKIVRSEEELYQPTWHYQVLVKELAASKIYDTVMQTLKI